MEINAVYIKNKRNYGDAVYNWYFEKTYAWAVNNWLCIGNDKKTNISGFSWK